MYWLTCHAVWAILKLWQETRKEGVDAESKADKMRETNKTYAFLK